MKVKCSICHHQCKLSDGQLGLCRARRNFGGEIRAENYGRVTSIALDPMRKSPYIYIGPVQVYYLLGATAVICVAHSAKIALSP